ncbi:MAG TPA: glycosyltransferase [Abditibacterium sp.]|jgi:GT2 family glycosyltransferase
MPRFSVVMPVHNRASLVGAAIESVLEQPGEKCEIIVVDDGSTDDTLKVLSNYKQHIQVFQQENQGPGAARNVGIKAARGDYIAFLDSDDLWLPWTLETYHRVLFEHKEAPALLLASSFSFEQSSEVKTLQPEKFQVEHFNDYLATSHKALSFGASSLVVRADVLHAAGGFASRWMNAEDLDLCLKLGTAPVFRLLHSPVTFGYRRHEGSAVSHLPRTLDGIHHLIAQERAGLYPGGQARERERIEIITRHIRPVALECLRRGAHEEGWKLYRATFGWQAKLRRTSFLAAFPLLMLKSKIQAQAKS